MQFTQVSITFNNNVINGPMGKAMMSMSTYHTTRAFECGVVEVSETKVLFGANSTSPLSLQTYFLSKRSLLR